MDGKERFVAIPVKKDDLEDAYHGLLAMMDVFPPICKRINLDGQGEQDARECRNHLQIAANACLSLLAMIDNMETVQGVKPGHGAQ